MVRLLHFSGSKGVTIGSDGDPFKYRFALSFLLLLAADQPGVLSNAACSADGAFLSKKTALTIGTEADALSSDPLSYNAFTSSFCTFLKLRMIANPSTRSVAGTIDKDGTVAAVISLSILVEVQFRLTSFSQFLLNNSRFCFDCVYRDVQIC
jgi:hypothetical protein